MVHISLKNGTAVVGIFLATMLILAPSFAMAQQANLLSGPQRALSNPDHSVTIRGKVGGVGGVHDTIVTIIARAASVTALVQCVNPGGNLFPPEEVQIGAIEHSKDFIKKPHGEKLNYAITLGPPTAEEIQCSHGNNAGWSTQLDSVIYNGLTVSAMSNNIQDGPIPTTPSTIRA